MSQRRGLAKGSNKKPDEKIFLATGVQAGSTINRGNSDDCWKANLYVYRTLNVQCLNHIAHSGTGERNAKQFI